MKQSTRTKIPGFVIRIAEEEDADLILRFITGLAAYEKVSHEVTATEDLLRETLFGNRQVAEVVIGEYHGDAVAFALFFHNYSTFLARPGIYLEDLFVVARRGLGLGKRLLDAPHRRVDQGEHRHHTTYRYGNCNLEDCQAERE